MGLGEGEWWLLARASIHRKEREKRDREEGVARCRSEKGIYR